MTHAYYNQKCDKLRLRWITPDPAEPHLYSLQIKPIAVTGEIRKSAIILPGCGTIK